MSETTDGTDLPARPVFTYGKGVPIAVGATFAIPTVFFTILGLSGFLSELGVFEPPLALARMIASAPFPPGLWLLVVLVGWADGAIGVWMIFRLLSRSELALTPGGVHAFRRKMLVRSVPWTDIRQITKLRSGAGRSVSTSVRIESPGESLEFGGQLRGYVQARRLISRYAKSYEIPLRLIDKSPDTIKGQRKLVSPAEYRTLQQTGILTEIEEL